MVLRFVCILLCFSFLFGSEIGNAFQRGKAKGHIGLFSHLDFVGDSTFLDLNTSFSYQSANFYGYKFFTSAWFNPPLYQVKDGFAKTKTWFEISELGLNFFNSKLNFGFDVGRFAYEADWVSNYVQGISFSHDYSPLISYGVTWINQSALITNYKNTGFYPAENWLGAVLLDASFKIPNTVVKITPYIYSVANMFWAPAIGAEANFGFLRWNANLIWKGTLLSYIAYHNKDYRGSGLLFYSDLTYRDKLRHLDAGGGIIATNGVKDLAVFGQNTEFENIDGILDGTSTTLYLFGKFHFPYDISLKTAMRLSMRGKENIFDFETRFGYFPIKKLELGLDFFVLTRKTNEKRDSYSLRAFLQYHF